MNDDELINNIEPPAPKFKAGDRVKLLDGGQRGTVMETPHVEQFAEPIWYRVHLDGYPEDSILKEEGLDGEAEIPFEGPMPELGGTLDPSGETWPDTLPWSEDEQNYYRHSSTYDRRGFIHDGQVYINNGEHNSHLSMMFSLFPEAREPNYDPDRFSAGGFIEPDGTVQISGKPTGFRYKQIAPLVTLALREKLSKTAASEFRVEKVDPFNDVMGLGPFGETRGAIHPMFVEGVDIQALNCYDTINGAIAGSTIYGVITDPTQLSMIGEPIGSPILWVEWIGVKEEYRQTRAFFEMGKQIMEDAGDLPIRAHYQNKDLQRVIERFEQRRRSAEYPADPFTSWKILPNPAGGSSTLIGYDPDRLYKFQDYLLELEDGPHFTTFNGQVFKGTWNPPKLFSGNPEFDYIFKDSETDNYIRLTQEELDDLKASGGIRHLPKDNSFVNEYSDVATRQRKRDLVSPNWSWPVDVPDTLPGGSAEQNYYRHSADEPSVVFYELESGATPDLGHDAGVGDKEVNTLLYMKGGHHLDLIMELEKENPDKASKIMDNYKNGNNRGFLLGDVQGRNNKPIITTIDQLFDHSQLPQEIAKIIYQIARNERTAALKPLYQQGDTVILQNDKIDDPQSGVIVAVSNTAFDHLYTVRGPDERFTKEYEYNLAHDPLRVAAGPYNIHYIDVSDIEDVTDPDYYKFFKLPDNNVYIGNIKPKYRFVYDGLPAHYTIFDKLELPVPQSVKEKGYNFGGYSPTYFDSLTNDPDLLNAVSDFIHQRRNSKLARSWKVEEINTSEGNKLYNGRHNNGQRPVIYDKKNRIAYIGDFDDHHRELLLAAIGPDAQGNSQYDGDVLYEDGTFAAYTAPIEGREAIRRYFNLPNPNDKISREDIMSRWVRKSDIGGSYTIQGGIVGAEGKAAGIAVRPDRQSTQEILKILDNLGGHKEDYQKQRQLIPDGALNRGGKTAADFRPGPGGIGVTMQQSAIVVAEGVDVQHNEILFHPNVRGIVAEKGGATSHGVVVARDRNIPIIVNVAEANRIMPGDSLQIDANTGIIHVNGGDPNFEYTGPQQADEPILGFVGSKGQGLSRAIEPGSEGAVAIHMELAMEGMQAGWFDMSDNGMGVMYEDGRVQLFQYPSDQESMVEGLNTIHPVTSVE